MVQYHDTSVLMVKPGIGIGEFIIGDSINHCLEIIQSNLENKPEIKIMYDSQSPLGADIIICIPAMGLQCRFEPESQRLRMIDVFDLSKIQLSYAHTTFTGVQSKCDSLLQLYKLFGPTFPGNFDVTLQAYLLNYRGLCLRFPIPVHYQQLYTSGSDSPLEFPDGTSPLASQLIVYGGAEITNTSVPKSSLPYLDELHVIVRGGSNASVSRAKTTFAYQHMRTSFSLGDSVQDILSTLGSPDKIYFKQNHKMKIHATDVLNNSKSFSGNTTKDNCFKSYDYFYNYFSLGLDLLFSSNKNVLKKVVLHTNFPGHSEFSIYNKSNFTLFFDSTTNSKGNNKKEKKSSSQSNQNKKQISADTKWKNVEELLGGGKRPMVRDNGAAANPFGATFLYAHNGCIFEVLRNGHIASVTVY